MILGIIIACVVAAFFYHRRRRSYWRKKHVFSIDGEFLISLFWNILRHKKTPKVFIDELYKKYKEKKLIGVYNFYQPVLVVTDIELIKQILITDFSSFSAHAFHMNPKAEPILTVHPFAAKDLDRWKYLRGIYKPVLSQARLREITSSFIKNGYNMIKYIEERAEKPILLFDIAKSYTFNNVSYISFGCEPTTFTDPNNGFRKYENETIFSATTEYAMLAATFCPALTYILPLRIISKEANDFFRDIIGKIFKYRKSSKESRNDLIAQVLKTEEKQLSQGKRGFTTDELAGIFLTSYMDSVETSTINLCYLLSELAINQAVQEKLRSEILKVGKEPQDFDFDKVHSIKYLDMVFNENLRLHSIILDFRRECTRTTRLRDVEIEKGTIIIIPYSPLVHDPEYFPNPEVFDPERFSETNKDSFVKGSFFPFGDGPRICLGLKYAQLQIKLATILILLKFRLKKPKDEATGTMPTSENFFMKALRHEELIFEKICD